MKRLRVCQKSKTIRDLLMCVLTTTDTVLSFQVAGDSAIVDTFELPRLKVIATRH